jgi:hypothetical protein
MTREPLFRRLLGPAFDDLHASIRAVHAGDAARFAGYCEVTRGEGLVSRILCAIARLPPSGTRVPVSVVIVPTGDGERWERDFGGHSFVSTLWPADGELGERVGAATFRYRLEASVDHIAWNLVGMRVLGVPLPKFARAAIDAGASVEEGSYRFDVSAAMPLVGLLVQYRGRLEPLAP